jgi:hypothetical protein
MAKTMIDLAGAWDMNRGCSGKLNSRDNEKIFLNAA